MNGTTPKGAAEGMKTIYLFAHIAPGGGLTRERVSECPDARDGETPIATLTKQPDNYWTLMRANALGAIELDVPKE
jgi:hypothetical protein